MATTITTNEMIFRTLKTKVWHYNGPRNPEPKYAEQLRAMGYTVTCDSDEWDVDARWSVNGRYIDSCEGKDLTFLTPGGYVEGMANIGKIDFENLFRVWDERNAKRQLMNAHDEIVDNSYYMNAYDWHRGTYRNMRVIRGYNAVIENYKSLRERINNNSSWERKRIARAQEKLIEAQKELDAAKAALAKAESRDAERLAELDELLKKHGVRK